MKKTLELLDEHGPSEVTTIQKVYLSCMNGRSGVQAEVATFISGRSLFVFPTFSRLSPRRR